MQLPKQMRSEGLTQQLKMENSAQKGENLKGYIVWKFE